MMTAMTEMTEVDQAWAAAVAARDRAWAAAAATAAE